MPETDDPEYIGGQPFPADMWGKAPLRGLSVRLVEEFVTARAKTGAEWTAGELVDMLIEKGVMPDELVHREVITKDPMLCNVLGCREEWAFDMLCGPHFQELRQ